MRKKSGEENERKRNEEKKIMAKESQKANEKEKK